MARRLARLACLSLAALLGASARAADAPAAKPPPLPAPAPGSKAPPDPDAAGVPTPVALDFERAGPDGAPEGLLGWSGRWAVVDDPLAPGKNRVLLQDATVPTWATTVLAGAGHAYADATATARFVLVSGRDDASGGIVFRARGPDDFYLARANALEDNLRLYVVKHGVRWQLASTTIKPPAPGTWHTLSVTFRGDTFRATLDGADVVEAKDATFARGWCGLWTKADSVTRFDDLRVEPAPEAGKEPSPPAPPPSPPEPKQPPGMG